MNSIQRAQALFQQMLPKERANNLVDEFLTERQAEAKKEEKETLGHAKQMEKKRGKSSTRKSKFSYREKSECINCGSYLERSQAAGQSN